MVQKNNIKFSGNSSGGHSCSQFARYLKTWDICGIVLCDKTAHFRVVIYCPQHKVHLCNNHGVIGFLIYQTCQVDWLSW